ncbi:MAG: copper resistance protein CopC, partial [Synechococcaceae cyanobacterium RM1_1_27]|nr:copper resistance protein CopC [Synechococcaceae cyanobacterium RM1_1_27]
MVLWGDLAFSHAVLLQTDPADGAALDIPPTEVVLTFNEQVQITQLQVLDNSGDPVHRGEIERMGETGQIALAPDLPKG